MAAAERDGEAERVETHAAAQPRRRRPRGRRRRPRRRRRGGGRGRGRRQRRGSGPGGGASTRRARAPAAERSETTAIAPASPAETTAGPDAASAATAAAATASAEGVTVAASATKRYTTRSAGMPSPTRAPARSVCRVPCATSTSSMYVFAEPRTSTTQHAPPSASSPLWVTATCSRESTLSRSIGSSRPRDASSTADASGLSRVAHGKALARPRTRRVCGLSAISRGSPSPLSYSSTNRLGVECSMWASSMTPACAPPIS